MELRWSGAHLRQNRARTAAHSARERQKSWKVSDRGIGYRMAHRNLPGRHRPLYDQPATNGGNWFAFDRASRKLLRDGWQSIDAAEAALEAANLTIWLPAQSDAIEFRCSAPR